MAWSSPRVLYKRDLSASITPVARESRPQVLSEAAAGLDHGRWPPEQCLDQPLAAKIAEHVEYFWFVRWRLAPGEEHIGRVLTDPAMHIVFEPGWSRVVGLVRGRFARTLWGQGQLIGARLRIGAMRQFDPRPVAEYSDHMLALATVLPRQCTETEARLFPLDETSSVQIFAQYLLERIAEHAPGVGVVERIGEIRNLVARIHTNEALLTVRDLAQESGLPARQLQRYFHDFVGASPKWVLRRARILDAAARLEAGATTNLSDLAQRLGYHDQAHFTRDFRNCVGTTPAKYGRA